MHEIRNLNCSSVLKRPMLDGWVVDVVSTVDFLKLMKICFVLCAKWPSSRLG